MIVLAMAQRMTHLPAVHYLAAYHPVAEAFSDALGRRRGRWGCRVASCFASPMPPKLYGERPFGGVQYWCRICGVFVHSPKMSLLKEKENE